MTPPQKRSLQRLSNYTKALGQFSKFIEKDSLNELEEQGLIKAFEYTYELGWKLLQDILRERGYSDIAGPRPVIEQAFKDGLILDGEGWMQMLQDRNLSTHTYDQETCKQILGHLRTNALRIFNDLKNSAKKA